MKLIDVDDFRGRLNALIDGVQFDLDQTNDLDERAELSGVLDGMCNARRLLSEMPVHECPLANAPLPPKSRKPKAADRVIAHLKLYPADRNLSAGELANKVKVGKTTAWKALTAFRPLTTVNGK